MTWANRPRFGFGLEAAVAAEVDRTVTAAVVQYDGGRPARVRQWVSGVGGAAFPAGPTRMHDFTTQAARAGGRLAALLAVRHAAGLRADRPPVPGLGTELGASR